MHRIFKNKILETPFSYKIYNFASNTAMDATMKLATEGRTARQNTPFVFSATKVKNGTFGNFSTFYTNKSP